MAKKTQALTLWEQSIQEAAAESAEMVANLGGGAFLSMKGGVLKLDGNVVPNNEVFVVVLDHIGVNAYGADMSDPDNPVPPSCYAFGYFDSKIAPDDDVKHPEAAKCSECPQNKFKSAANGRGKACKNRRKLAVIECGGYEGDVYELPESPEDLVNAPIAYLNVPPTSLKMWGNHVKKIAAAKKPPFAVVTRIFVEQSDSNFFEVHFEPIKEIPAEFGEVIMARRAEAQESIVAKFETEEEEAPRKSNKKASSRKAASKKTASRASSTTRRKKAGRRGASKF